MNAAKHNNKEPEKNNAQATHDNRLKCEDIQSVLFSYMSRELGSARSDLVREHLRKCPDCRELAADIQSTIDLFLKARAEEEGVSMTLSDDHRKRMLKALTHPILHWITENHILVSIVATVIVLVGLALVLCTMKVRNDRPEPGPTFKYKGADVGWIRADIDEMETEGNNGVQSE
ncbi:MAG: zf-HC2 domain-containing protein [Kiritimatiellae bacterium]|nr:zf-HC2 domain-containing protein [Kiritimatiellia bacterium]